MGENKKATLAMARKELEDLYSGVPDDSVNLTFQDLAQVIHQKKPASQSSLIMEPISESNSSPRNHNNHNPQEITSPSLAKLPSLDFSKAFETSLQANPIHQINNYHHMPEGGSLRSPRGHDHHHRMNDLNQHHMKDEHNHHHHMNEHNQHHQMNEHNLHHHNHHAYKNHGGHSLYDNDGDHGHHHRSFVYDDTSHYVSGISMAMGQERSCVRSRRPGIPHSNICTVCCNYIYLFRHRCLVCGRVYCRQCVRIGMGDMAEGRKCIECLGKRFSSRYIHKAGNVGCCIGYPSTVKQQELIWAEKGPRRSGHNDQSRYGHSVMARSRPNDIPRSPTPPMSQQHSAMNSPSFVVGSPYSSHASRHNHFTF